MNELNPLRQYFRQPVIYLRLPSNGEFYPPGALDMPPNGELPILPMTAVDEITYRTPDALFNGAAVVNVIQSCVPNIKDAWSIPAMDVDSILIAIRIASYGHSMEFETVCPECSHESANGIDLRSVLDRIKSPDYKATIQHGDLEIFFQPMNYKNLNDNGQMQFEEQKILSILPNSEVSEAEKIRAINEAMKNITTMTVRALAQSISAIKTPSAFVNEYDHISNFLENCDRKLFNQIRDHIIEIRTQSDLKPFDLECPECHHHYQQSLTLDMTSFFAAAS